MTNTGRPSKRRILVVVAEQGNKGDAELGAHSATLKVEFGVGHGTPCFFINGSR
jgi:hypothetical protein